MTALPRRGLPVVALCFGVVVLAGCVGGDGMPPAGVVRGTVKYRGQPLAYGNVVFYPTGGGREAAAQIGADGSYAVYEVAPGENKVVVVASDPRAKGPGYPGQTIPKGAVVKDAPAETRVGGGPAAPKQVMLPVKYGKSESTPLICSVTKNTEQRFDIELAD